MSSSMIVTFPEGQRVDADLGGGMIIKTNQDGSAPPPYALFLASLGTCAGIYVLSFCQSRGIPTDGIYLEQSMENSPITGKLSKISIDITVPEDFPPQYRDTLVRVANQCAVKATMADPPEIAVQTVVV